MLEDLYGKDRFTKAIELMKAGEAVIVDVRTPDEFVCGHVPGALNLPVEKLATSDIDYDVPILVYCMSGARSERAMVFLKEQNFVSENIGGIIDYEGEFEV